MKTIVINQSKEREAYVPAKVREFQISTQKVMCLSFGNVDNEEYSEIEEEY